MPSQGGGGSGTPILDQVSAVLGSDVPLTTALTYVDLLSVSITAGTWLLLACGEALQSSSGQGVTTWKVWDGTTVYGTFEGFGSATSPESGSCIGRVVAVGTKTVKLSAANSFGTSTAKAAGIQNGTPGGVTQLIALRTA